MKYKKLYVLVVLIAFLCCTSNFVQAQVTFIIESLPETTPAQEGIYITGTFNDWNTQDSSYMLFKQPNGRLAITLDFQGQAHEYKFTRGNFLKVETSENNVYLPNRILHANESGNIYIQILNWQDLGGARSFQYMVFYYFGIAFLALIIILLSSRIQKKDIVRIQIFSAVNESLIALFIGVVVYYIVNPIWQTYILILGQVLIFSWGPILYFFVRNLISNSVPKRFYYHFVPTIMAFLFAIIRLINFESLAFINLMWNENLTWGELFLIVSGTSICLFYLVFLINSVSKALFSREENKTEYLLAALFMLINLVLIIIVLIGTFASNLLISQSIFNLNNLVFILFSSIVILEAYFLWKDPSLLKEKQTLATLHISDELPRQLIKMMEVERAYRDAELNITSLAEMMDSKSHVLSKLLNEHHHQNFRDFVNGYRIKEFIALANAGKLENLTFLGLAHEVGFNSKSTFNLAFKKTTNKSPRDYFKNNNS